MPRARSRYRDDWSDDSESDDYRVEKIKKISRSHSRHNHRSPREEEPVINYFENKLFVPGQDRGRSRSGSRGGGYGRDSERELEAELMLTRLQLEKTNSHGRHDDYDEDRYRQRYEEDRRRKELEWQMEDAKRKEDRRREEMKREIEEDRKRRDADHEAALREAEEKEKEAKRKREKMEAEFKAAAAKKEADDKAERERILLEEAYKKKEAEAKEEATKKRILAEVAAEKAKKELEEKEKNEEFKAWVRQNAIKHGLDPDKAVAQLTESQKSKGKEIVVRRGVRRRVRVRRDHILPQTLDSYNLSWRYEDDPNFIIIEDEVDDDFLYELQTDSERIIKSRKLITPGYKKETITTLTPGGSHDSVRKKGGKYYMVRKRSVSRSRFGISDLI